MGLLQRLFRRVNPETQPALAVRPGCTPIAEAPLGRIVRIAGEISSVILRPETTVAALEAEIDDGTARLRIVWLGRNAIRGIEPGRGIIIEGRVVERDDMRLMHNPRYELLPRTGAHE